jgi:hypothetical protein
VFILSYSFCSVGVSREPKIFFLNNHRHGIFIHDKETRVFFYFFIQCGGLFPNYLIINKGGECPKLYIPHIGVHIPSGVVLHEEIELVQITE